jgi:hypothetical protein
MCSNGCYADIWMLGTVPQIPEDPKAYQYGAVYFAQPFVVECIGVSFWLIEVIKIRKTGRNT